MLIQRRPGASTISTRGSSAGAISACERARAERRPKGERGRLGMAATERIVGRWHQKRFYAAYSHSQARASGLISCAPWYRSKAATHPEGWRDWPYEAPPTIPRKRETVAIPSGSKTTAWEMRRRAPPRTPAAAPGGGSNQVPVDALKCKECSTTYPLDARYVCERCFGPLEVAYSAPESEPDALRRRIQA